MSFRQDYQRVMNYLGERKLTEDYRKYKFELRENKRAKKEKPKTMTCEEYWQDVQMNNDDASFFINGALNERRQVTLICISEAYKGLSIARKAWEQEFTDWKVKDGLHTAELVAKDYISKENHEMMLKEEIFKKKAWRFEYYELKKDIRKVFNDRIVELEKMIEDCEDNNCSGCAIADDIIAEIVKFQTKLELK